MLEIIFYSSLGIIGTAIGAVFGIFFGTKKIGKTLALTAGIMLGIVVFEILPLSYQLSDFFTALVACAIGVLGITLISALIGKANPFKQDNRMLNMGLVILVSMALHNFPEGMAIGAGGAESSRTGLLVGLTIAFHDLPEGIAVAIPFVGGKLAKRRVFFLTLLSAFSTVLGALVGYLLGSISDYMNAVSLGVAGGAMLFVVFRELLPASLKDIKVSETILYLLTGILISIILISVI